MIYVSRADLWIPNLVTDGNWNGLLDVYSSNRFTCPGRRVHRARWMSRRIWQWHTLCPHVLYLRRAAIQKCRCAFALCIRDEWTCRSERTPVRKCLLVGRFRPLSAIGNMQRDCLHLNVSFCAGFSDAGSAGGGDGLRRPASEKRQGTKSREMGRRWCRSLYGDLSTARELAMARRRRPTGRLALPRGRRAWFQRSEACSSQSKRRVIAL